MRALILALPLVLAAATAARADFDSCVAGLRSAAAAKGVSGATFDRAMSGVTPDMKVIEAMNNQPEFKTPIWDYLGTLVDDEKVAEGRSMMRQHASTLAAAEQRFGVDRHTIAAVWGVESDFGKARGKMPLVQALSTGACLAPRRNAFFKGELIATLQIIERGDVRADRLFGSWAGAFGHTQFIPSTYLRLAVDGDGDGRRDLVDSIPDALHSTANFMAKAGWVTGAGWGYEVRVPGGYSGPTGRNPKQPVSSWAARGVVKFDGSALSGSGNAGLLMPAGRNGPAFLVFKNYDAAYSYNGADSYALAISLLSDRLRGRPGVQGDWPTDDLPLSREQRRELQRLLTQRGYNVGEPDGAVGALTRAAIKEIESKIGMPQTGRPGEKVLRALKGGRV
ncbi:MULTISPECIES: lytic murein transglycosylase [unclassified Bosea (in: a-proteobacteria)]|uniref:lytic murein transglycosylase n=1 Tax=unclassified Bosea (in: a-proteobacteria) TaxID=2653178 RepID=UPI000F761155|nr:MULTISPECIES: lytic murein transglycosylase [unclassified Bosea (in: a-proteobacteria)]AZO78553.1 lytic transglycosylase [Bosea sp. Tri-49]RXT17662.1 lytic transglycosylase [Bosea sp. Tri-39]RXT41035.1 lytic transglycosylase [Bosea sp. Tri-54]